jgi:hypothetical protein
VQVRIKQEAKSSYIGYMVHSCRSSYSDTYAKTMARLAGRVCDIDEQYDFPTSYNVIDPDNPDKIISVQKLFCEEI